MGRQAPLGAKLHVAGEAAAGEAVVVDLVHADQRREGVGALPDAPRVGPQVDVRVAGAGAAHVGQQQRDAVDLELAATKPHGFLATAAPPRESASDGRYPTRTATSATSNVESSLL